MFIYEELKDYNSQNEIGVSPFSYVVLDCAR
jgi:hypothetical protein